MDTEADARQQQELEEERLEFLLLQLDKIARGKTTLADAAIIASELGISDEWRLYARQSRFGY